MARILVVTNLYPPHHYGGYELSCRDAVEGWRERGHDVTVLTGSSVVAGPAIPAGESRQEVRRDLTVFMSDGRFLPSPLRKRFGVERRNHAALDAALEAVRPDVVSVWHMAGVSLGLLTTLVRRQHVVVCVICDEWPGYICLTDPWMKPWVRWPRIWPVVERVTGVPTGVPPLGDAASFCFSSHNIRDRCLKSSPWFFPMSTVTYLGLNTEEFPLTAPTHTDQWSWNLVTAGRLDPRKGFATAIRAMTHLPASARLEILASGDTPYRRELQTLADSVGVGDRVRFSFQDRHGLRSKFLAADAVIFPSEWDEPFGLVPVEAMSCAVPVVATGTGGSGEYLVDGENCLRFRAGDVHGLAGSLRRLADSPALRSHLVRSGQKTASMLTTGHLVDSLEEWHLAAMEGFAGGRPRPRDTRPYRQAGQG